MTICLGQSHSLSLILKAECWALLLECSFSWGLHKQQGDGVDIMQKGQGCRRLETCNGKEQKEEEISPGAEAPLQNHINVLQTEKTHHIKGGAGAGQGSPISSPCNHSHNQEKVMGDSRGQLSGDLTWPDGHTPIVWSRTQSPSGDQ